MAETFKLPASSFEEILKLVQAYANEREGITLSLDDISHSTGVPRTVVSGNNGFLVQMGLITEGNKKASTEIGRSLGRAYIHKITDEIERIWKEIITENDFLTRMISAVRIRNGMDRTSFLNHIIYSSGQKDTKQNRTGAGAIIEIFKSINLLNEIDGKLTVIEEIDKEKEIHNENQIAQQPPVSATLPEKQVYATATASPVTINININCNADEIDGLAAKIKELLKGLSE